MTLHKETTTKVKRRSKVKWLDINNTLERSSHEREVRMDTSTNYATDQPNEVPFNFPPNYDLEDMPRRSVNVFDRLSPGKPRNRQAQLPLVPRNRQKEHPRFER